MGLLVTKLTVWQSLQLCHAKKDPPNKEGGDKKEAGNTNQKANNKGKATWRSSSGDEGKSKVVLFFFQFSVEHFQEILLILSKPKHNSS